MGIKNLPIIRWFFKEEEKEQYPSRFINIVLSDVAKMKGIKDDSNKLIRLIEYGEIHREYPYSKELLDAMIQTDPLPVYEENYNSEEEFEYAPFEEIGVAKYKS